jgi:hypothetical protein
MVIPPVHVKIGLMENYAKALSRKISFWYPQKEFLQMVRVKMKSGIFIGRHKGQHRNDRNFAEVLEESRRQRENPASIF